MRLFLILLLIAPLTSLPAQKKCYKCKSTGVIPCKKKDHDPKRHCGKWKFEHRCTGVWNAPCCRGLEKVWCERCNDPVAEAEIMSELKSRADWVKRHREYLRRAGIQGVTVETKDFRVHCSMRRWSQKGARHTRSKAAHLFAYRLQKTADRFREICGRTPGGKQTLMLCETGAENLSFTLHHMGGGHRNAFRQNGPSGLVCTWPDPSRPAELKKDENMHSHVVHLGTHLLHYPNIQMHRQPEVWFDIGLAHWLELDQTGQTRNFCINEGAGTDPWREANWKKRLHSEVSKKSEIKFATVLSYKNLDQTQARDHAYAWSFVDYLIALDGEKFKKFYREIKTLNDSKKALDKVYNVSTASLHDRWRKWVLKEYGPK